MSGKMCLDPCQASPMSGLEAFAEAERQKVDLARPREGALNSAFNSPVMQQSDREWLPRIAPTAGRRPKWRTTTR
jgi:hypothetical protein